MRHQCKQIVFLFLVVGDGIFVESTILVSRLEIVHIGFRETKIILKTNDQDHDCRLIYINTTQENMSMSGLIDIMLIHFV